MNMPHALTYQKVVVTNMLESIILKKVKRLKSIDRVVLQQSSPGRVQ